LPVYIQIKLRICYSCYALAPQISQLQLIRQAPSAAAAAAGVKFDGPEAPAAALLPLLALPAVQLLGTSEPLPAAAPTKQQSAVLNRSGRPSAHTTAAAAAAEAAGDALLLSRPQHSPASTQQMVAAGAATSSGNHLQQQQQHVDVGSWLQHLPYHNLVPAGHPSASGGRAAGSSRPTAAAVCIHQQQQHGVKADALPLAGATNVAPWIDASNAAAMQQAGAAQAQQQQQQQQQQQLVTGASPAVAAVLGNLIHCGTELVDDMMHIDNYCNEEQQTAAAAAVHLSVTGEVPLTSAAGSGSKLTGGKRGRTAAAAGGGGGGDGNDGKAADADADLPPSKASAVKGEEEARKCSHGVQLQQGAITAAEQEI
jgi:hypothetical protein